MVDLEERDHFLREVLDFPEDDAPRLIYADWLEESGDPRGEFIRVQCEMAQRDELDPYFYECRDRSSALLAQYGEGWSKDLKQDVRKKNKPQVDVLAAQNFSFWIFKTRKEVTKYFRIAHANLNDRGIMVMDMMGGGGCLVEGQTDKRTIVKGKKGFKYHWEQARFNPITADCSFYISFKFPDGSKLNRAFEYHWRFWSIPEVREMLRDAGFSASYVYWEKDEEDGDDDAPDWYKCAEAPSDDCWIAYIVAVK